MKSTNKPIQKNPTSNLLKKISNRFLVVLASCLITSIGYAQCTASFTAVDNGNGNYTFTNISTGTTANTNYSWNIVNPFISLGNSSTSFNYTFMNGTYLIILSIEDSAAGCYNSNSQSITVTSGVSCTTSAGFTFANDTNGIVNFTSTSTGNFNTELWIFGDGTNGIGTNPTHTYAANGTYGVCLAVGDSLFSTCFDTLCSTVVISNVTSAPCNISANYSYTDNGSGNFSFSNNSINTTQYSWNFGDGNGSSLTNPNHTFAANGTYTVVLLAYDSASNLTCLDYSFQTIIVTGVVSGPSCNAGYSMYLDSLTNNVIVVNSSTGTNLSYFWSFGDGNTSTLAFPSYTYTTPGPFYLCLTVTDSNNSCTSTYCDSIGSNGIVLKQTGFTINVESPIVTSITENNASISELKTYPNPFNETVFIELTLTKNTNVETYVTDLLGTTVGVINNELMPSGLHKLQWNAHNLANGIYLLNIKTGNDFQVKKLVLNK